MENDELRTASSLRFIFTKKKKEIKVVEIKKNQDLVEGTKQRKVPGRRQTETTQRKKTEKEQDIQKKKQEWGKAFKFIQDNKPPVYEIFIKISETPECSGDMFYSKVFREMAYGSFPKGIFYDSNRDTLVCTEPPGKRNQAIRRKKFEKYVRVCLPLRPQIDFEQRTTLPSRDETSENWNDDIPPVEAIDTINEEDAKEKAVLEEYRNRKIIKYIHRSYQRLELPVLALYESFHLSLERIYQEIKLFIYMSIDIISPKDSILLQEDSYQSIQTGEIISSLKPNRVWKRLSKIEQISLLCQYCKREFLRCEGQTLSNLSYNQTKTLREVEDTVVGLYQTRWFDSDSISFDGTNVTEIKGVVIGNKGSVQLDLKPKNSNEIPIPDNIIPVPIQEYKSVDLQKISNSITKQVSKYSKMVQDLTGVLDQDDF
jgi:hypothetical protein